MSNEIEKKNTSAMENKETSYEKMYSDFMKQASPLVGAITEFEKLYDSFATAFKQYVEDTRKSWDPLDENTRKAYEGKTHTNEYDRSVFVEAVQNDETGDCILYVPSSKRMRWFKTDYPCGVVIPDPPIFTGKRVTIVAKVYKTPDDLEKNLPCAVNSCTRILDDDKYTIDAAVTRAQSRALRDMGYDLPCDAHEIPGWTPIHVVHENKNLPEDAIESQKNVIVNIPIINTPAAPVTVVTEKPAVTPAPIIAPPIMVEDMDNTASSEPKKNDTQENDTAVTRQEHVKARRSHKPKEDVAMKTNTTLKEKSSTDSAQTENASAVQNKPSVIPTTSVVDKQKNGFANLDELYAKAKTVFANSDEALAYTCRLLGKRTVKDQNLKRVNYFAKKAVEGALRDENLGYACAIVAKECPEELASDTVIH